MHSSTASTKWETRVQRKRAALTVAIPAEWRLTTVPTISERSNVVELPKEVLSDEEIIITETPAVAVLANVHALVWSAEEVTRAFCHRAAIAHQLVNCLTEVLFDEAIVTAQELDRYYQMSGRLKGPLHGLPISFMDRFRISGAETSSGFVSWLGPKEATDAEGPLVRHLRSLGAVPICKTNVPQSMMLGNTTNNIFGSTLNPYNRCLSAGGAAGGEGALLAMRGSPFGWTTEIAGSTRIPATFNNLFALKTSLGRLPTLGVASSNTTLPIGNATIGMLAPDLGSLLHISRLTLGSSAYQEDPAWLDLPWRENKFLRCHLQKRQPTFAILMDDGHVQPQPPIKRALSTVAQVLRSHGYEILEWRPPAHSPAVETLFRMIGADGAHEIRAHIERSGEPPVEQLRKWFADRRSTESMSVGDYWALSKARTDYIASYQSYWRSTAATTLNNQSVDGVIMPITAHSACFENELNYFGYSAIVNHLDFTSVAFPVTFVDQSVDVRAAQHKIWNDEDARIQASYDPVLQHGMPVGLQVMCRRIEEEVALTLTQVIMQTCGPS